MPNLTKPELGTKRDCPSCGAKFYDLNKSPAVCPKCKHEFVPDQVVKTKRAKPAEKPKEKAPVRPKTRVEPDEDGNVSLDAMRDEELADDADEDLLADIADDVEDDDDADDAFLPDDEDDDDDVSSIVRGGGGDDE
ncbi:MAG: TIGR02300 family protein [Parvibaculum sp.]|nr:TIGR02300 family protein [Parvibaculum sp.]